MRVGKNMMRRDASACGLLALAGLLGLLFAASDSLASASVSITLNGRPLGEYGSHDPYAYLFRVEGKRFVSAGTKSRISESGIAEVSLPGREGQWVLQIYVPGALTPLYSLPLKEGDNRWDITAAVIKTDAGLSGRAVSLYGIRDGAYENLWKKSKVLSGGTLILPLPERGGPFVAGMESDEGARFSAELRPGHQVWDTGWDSPPLLREVSDIGVEEGGRALVNVSAWDPEGGGVRFSLNGAPGFALLKDWKDGTASIVFRPLWNDAGAYELEVAASDGKGESKKGFKVIVRDSAAKAARAAKAETASGQASFVSGTTLTAIWANDGCDKVAREELRASNRMDVRNSVWDGKDINVSGARNETVSFNMVLEAGKADVKGMTVEFYRLTGPNGYEISSRKAGAEDLFDYRGRNIEVFQVGYLQIRGLSRLGYDPTYDERHVPLRLRLPYTLPKGTSKGLFTERPGAYSHYPDIAVPIEAAGAFGIKTGESQCIWVDIYIPKDAPAGAYHGKLKISEAGKEGTQVPVTLEVLPFSLPDEPYAKTMVYLSEENINDRYLGKKWIDEPKETPERRRLKEKVWNAHHKMAHRHRLSLIDDGTARPEKMGKWVPVLSGRLFTAGHGYEGPGEGRSSGVYSIGTYGAWRNMWDKDSEAAMRSNADLWAGWFSENLPGVEYFLYLLDEPRKDDFEAVERWAGWVRNNPGKGKGLKTLVTKDIVSARSMMPSVDIAFTGWGDERVWRRATAEYLASRKSYWAYNGSRPASGSFMIEDEGISLRVIGWTHFKHKVGRWFYWESTHYKNTSHTNLETNVFESAWTFGRKGERAHQKYGETGHNYSNGDGVLFYPGTERRFPENSFDLPGPIASLRMKLWRRGIQDADYLAMASKVDPAAVERIVNRMVPKVLWEVGVSDPGDPTYVHADISWPVDPDRWEEARRELAGIIMRGKDAR